MAKRARFITGGRGLLNMKVNSFQPGSHTGVPKRLPNPDAAPPANPNMSSIQDTKAVQRLKKKLKGSNLIECSICHGVLHKDSLPQHLIRTHGYIACPWCKAPVNGTKGMMKHVKAMHTLLEKTQEKA